MYFLPGCSSISSSNISANKSFVRSNLGPIAKLIAVYCLLFEDISSHIVTIILTTLNMYVNDVRAVSVVHSAMTAEVKSIDRGMPAMLSTQYPWPGKQPPVPIYMPFLCSILLVLAGGGGCH